MRLSTQRVAPTAATLTTLDEFVKKNLKDEIHKVKGALACRVLGSAGSESSVCTDTELRATMLQKQASRLATSPSKTLIPSTPEPEKKAETPARKPALPAAARGIAASPQRCVHAAPPARALPPPRADRTAGPP